MRPRTSGHAFRRHRTHHLVVVTALLLGGGAMLWQAAPPAAAQDQQARPGATDPMGKPSRYTLFPSHQLLVTQPGDETTFTTFKSDPNLDRLDSTGETSIPTPPGTAPMLVAAAGRILAPDRDQVVYARREGSDVKVGFLGHGVSYTLQGLNSDAGFFSQPDTIALAVGDVDKRADKSGNFHDEVVVAYVGPISNNLASVTVAVLNYTNDAANNYGAPVAVTAITTTQRIDAGTSTVDSSTIWGPDLTDVLRVVVGDFDGDGQNEIAAICARNPNTLQLAALRYTTDDPGNHQLQELGSVTQKLTNSQFSGSVSAQAGDFNGDGVDEVVVTAATIVPPSDAFYFNHETFIFQGDQNLNLKQVGYYSNPITTVSPAAGFTGYNLIHVEVVAGLFQLDPAQGYNLNRRQFAIVWNSFDGGTIYLQAYSVSDDLQTITPLYNQTQVGTDNGQDFTATAGALRGNGDIQNAAWAVAVNTWDKVWVFDVGTSSTNLAYWQPNLGGNTCPRCEERWARLPVVAYDSTGDSLYLGAPIHLTLEGAISTDFILQEPPKHTYYDNLPGSPTYGQIVTVSRYDAFNVAMVDSNSTTFQSMSTDTTDWSIGGSAAISAGATVTEGANVGITGAKVEIKTDFTVRGSYDYEDHKKDYNSSYGSRTLSITGTTDRDDYVSGKVQLIDVWRYRVYGNLKADAGSQLNAFYDFVLPSSCSGSDNVSDNSLCTPINAGGLSFSWYQPWHENGNILSYPALSDAFRTPADLGSYTLPDGTQKTEPMVPASLQSWDGKSGQIHLEYSDSSGSGSERTYSHTLATSADLKVSGSVNVNDFGTGGEFRASADFEFHDKNSWGNIATSSNTTNQTTDLTLTQKPAGNRDQSYNYYPIFYITADGTVKVAHAVDNPATTQGASSIFWSGFYGRGPDPALNLPGRFSTNGTDANGNQPWYPTTDLSRKAMRGFFLRQPNLNPVTGDYDYLADTPLLGDQVRIDARVYNYSTAKQVDTLKVRFQVVEIDPDTQAEIDPNLGPRDYNVQVAPGNRTTIGDVIVPHLDALGTATASIVWDTGAVKPPGFGSVPAGASQTYRVYVVLDPDNTIPNEIYEAEVWDSTGANIDPGQNNEGFGSITISHPSVGGAPRSNHCDPLVDPRCGNNAADVYLRADSLAGLETVGLGKDLPRLKTDKLTAYFGQPLRLRAAVYTDQSHREFSHLLLYDGDPGKGGQLITDQIVHTGDAVRGSKVWVAWTPSTLGEHRLYARLLEKSGDKQKGNNTATLVVNVVPYDFSAPTLAVKLSPNVLHPADGRLVPITATLTVRDDQDAHPVIKLESITSSEASGPTPDVTGAEFGTDDRSFSLRAGQSAKAGPGRLYTVVYSATDASGNKTSATAYVRVLASGARAPGCNWGDTHNCGK